MKNLPNTFKHIGAILSFDTPHSELQTTLSDSKFDWDAIVMLGSSHLVLPAIYCRLKSKGLLHVLPEDLNTYLENLTAINRNRNRSLILQIQSISELLNENNINHVFVKGAALLALSCFEDNAERMVGDIDILVCKSQLHDAFDLLKVNGYDKTFGFDYDNKDFRHLDRLISNTMLAAVELHGELLLKPYRHLIAVDEVLKYKIIKNDIAIPNLYYLSLHHIFAWQLNDMGFLYKKTHFKHLYDSVVLKVHMNPDLMAYLLNLNFGQAYLAIAQCYFREFTSIPQHKRLAFYRQSHQNHLNKPLYKNVITPIKQGYLFTKTRLQLFLFNPSYRKHALKKIFIKKK